MKATCVIGTYNFTKENSQQDKVITIVIRPLFTRLIIRNIHSGCLGCNVYNAHFSLLKVVDRLPRKRHNYFNETDSGLVSIRVRISPHYSLLVKQATKYSN